MKFIKFLLFLVLVLIVVIVAGKDWIVKNGVENGVERVAGVPLKMQSLHIGLLDTTIDIRDLRLKNSANFTEETMMLAPEIYVNYDLPALLRQKIHLIEARLSLKELYVIRNKDNELNLLALKSIGSKGKAQKQPEPAPKKEGKPPEVQIDRLLLSIGKVVMIDHTKGETPQVREFVINYKEEFRNITDPNALVGIIVGRALANTPLQLLGQLQLGDLPSQVTGSLGTVTDVTSGAIKQTEDVLKGTAEGFKNLLGVPETSR